MNIGNCNLIYYLCTLYRKFSCKKYVLANKSASYRINLNCKQCQGGDFNELFYRVRYGVVLPTSEVNLDYYLDYYSGFIYEVVAKVLGGSSL